MAELGPLAAPLVMLAGTVVLLVTDLFLPVERKRALGWGAVAVVLASLLATFACPDEVTLFNGAWAGGAGTTFLVRLLLVATLPVLLGSVDFVHDTWKHRQGEYHVLLLLSLLGMILLPGARDLVLLITCFELMSIPLYVLASYGKTDGVSKTAAAEAGLKLYVIGAASSAVALFGLSLVAVVAGGTSYSAVAAAPHSPLLALGALLVLGGLAFKIGVAPFHAWVPDTYEGAATPFVAFLSVAPKIAGFAALVAVLLQGLGAERATWLPVVLALSALTMTVGSLLAIPQSNVKRVLAFSGVAQVGYVLLGLAAGDARGVAMLLFYLVAYALTNAGIFLVAHAVASEDGDETIGALDGLARRTPWLAAALLMFLLSLAGIPFVAGFWAKLYVFIAAWQAGFAWIVLLGAVLAVVGLFYYLGLAKAAYVSAPKNEASVRVRTPLAAAILFCLAGVILLGLWPAPLLEAAERAATAILAR